MNPSVYYCIISLFIISPISFNFALLTTDTTLPSETVNDKVYTSRRLTVQNFMVILLDSSIDEFDNDYWNSITQLRAIVNTVYTFTNTDQCIDFVNQIKDEKVFLILSDDLVQSTVPLIHDKSQVDSIYVFSKNNSKYEQSTKSWTKIKDMFTRIDPILDALTRDTQQCERDSLAFSITSGSLYRLDPMFLYTYLLKKILIEIKHDSNAKKELVGFCRKQYLNNSHELQKINAFERDYNLDTAIWWYTQKCFIYQMLNRALRTQEIEVLMKMDYFLCDLQRQIEELHSKKIRNSSPFIVYRGQGISNIDLERIKTTNKGDLLAFNNFLTAGLNKKVALQFARNSLHNPDLVGILFNMTINTSISINPFVSRRQVDAFKNEKEGILFSIYTVFRIVDIKPLENRLWEVELALIGDDEQKQLLQRIQKETSKSTGWQRLADLLMRMRNFDKAEEAYQILLQKTSKVNEKTLPHLYNQLGRIKHSKRYYMEALEFYQKALQIQQESLPSNHLDFVSTYNNIGSVHDTMGNYSEALDFYRKTLQIQQDLLPSNHRHLITTYNKIGLAHKNMKEYPRALDFFQKTLQIQENSLSSNNTDFGATYINIASVHYNMNEYSKALLYYKKAIKIYKKSFPNDHPYLATIYGNIGSLQKDMGEYSIALEYFQKALEIREKSLRSNHSDLVPIYNGMGSVYVKMKQYPEALDFYLKALEIQEKLLSSDDPNLATTYHSIASTHYSMEDYPKALKFFEKTLQIQQKSLPPNHLDMAAIYYYMGSVHHHMKEDSIARSYFERAVEIGQLSLPENHSQLELYQKHLNELQHQL